MSAASAQTVARLSALGDQQRLLIVECLRAGPRSVNELAANVPSISRPAVSRHLRVLREAGLVSDRAVGTRRVYSLRTDSIADVARYLDDLWGDALDRFADHARSIGAQ